MGSTAATAQSYNDLNVLGEILQIGAGKNTGQFMSLIGGMATERGGGVLGDGIRRVIGSQQFEMGKTWSLDAGSQPSVDESSTLTAGTPTFYADSLEFNITQIFKEEIAVSNRRESSNQQLDTSSLSIGKAAVNISEFDKQAQRNMAQVMTDWEWSSLNGTFADRVNVSTAEGMGGIITAMTTNTTAAAAAALSKDLMDTALEEMATNGAPMDRPTIVCKPKYVTLLSEIYGFQPQAWDIGGVAVKNIMTDFGVVGIVWTNNAPANTLSIIDIEYVQPALQPVLGQDILMREFIDGGSAKKGYIEGYLSIDYGTEAYHGKITGLA
jgi:hypothetical protein